MIDWIVTYRKSILTYGLGAFAVIFSSYSIYNKVRPHKETDYLMADVYFHKWADGDHHDKELLAKVDKITAEHPELHPKYDSLIAERLLVWNEPTSATGYLLSALKRVEAQSLYFPEFARTTLLISQGDLKEALEDAKALMEEMQADSSLFAEGDLVRWEGLLYAFNLVRIGMLEKEVGSFIGEQKAWDELIGLKNKDPEAFSTIQYHFRENNITLFDYISSRR
ncbi:MAG: hypothetical protein V4494_05010 [Chlamydiota bacterium]